MGKRKKKHYDELEEFFDILDEEEARERQASFEEEQLSNEEDLNYWYTTLDDAESYDVDDSDDW